MWIQPSSSSLPELTRPKVHPVDSGLDEVDRLKTRIRHPGSLHRERGEDVVDLGAVARCARLSRWPCATIDPS